MKDSKAHRTAVALNSSNPVLVSAVKLAHRAIIEAFPNVVPGLRTMTVVFDQDGSIIAAFVSLPR